MTLGESAVVPVLGGTGMGTGSGLAAGAGGAVGAILGSMLGNGGFGNGWGNRGGSPAADAAAASVVLNPAFESLQNQITGIASTLNAHNIDAGLTSVNQNISGTSRDIGRDIANLSTAQATSAFTTLNSINGLGRDITAAQTQALINNLQNFNTLQGNLTTSTNQIIAGQNAQNANFANCCCEIKQLIQSDGNLTRALINDNTIQALRDKNTELQVSVSNNAQNQYLLNTILTHIKPTTPVVS